jgi:outer membrane murein-binding lipoprotein Lpp
MTVRTYPEFTEARQAHACVFLHSRRRHSSPAVSSVLYLAGLRNQQQIEKLNRMKPIRSASIVQTILLVAVLIAGPLLSGCKTTATAQSLENKSFAITQLVATKVLANNPAPKYRHGFELARDDLKLIAESPEFGLPELMQVINRLPEGALGKGDNAIYIETGILFFSDELGAVAVDNPEQVQAAARGMARALDRVLAK